MPFAYLITIAANAMRIILWHTLFPVVDKVVPLSFHGALHQCAGMLIFLPVLCGVYIVADRRLSHADKVVL